MTCSCSVALREEGGAAGQRYSRWRAVRWSGGGLRPGTEVIRCSFRQAACARQGHPLHRHSNARAAAGAENRCGREKREGAGSCHRSGSSGTSICGHDDAGNDSRPWQFVVIWTVQSTPARSALAGARLVSAGYSLRGFLSGKTGDSRGKKRQGMTCVIQRT